MMQTTTHSNSAGNNQRNKYFIKVSQAAIPRSILRMTSPIFLRKCQSKLKRCPGVRWNPGRTNKLKQVWQESITQAGGTVRFHYNNISDIDAYVGE